VTNQPVEAIQFVKQNARGVVIRSDEAVALQQIQRVFPAPVRQVNTSRIPQVVR
jgi:hypothetical protein